MRKLSTPATDAIERERPTKAEILRAMRILESAYCYKEERIAELEAIMRQHGIKVSAPIGHLLSPHDITEPIPPANEPPEKQP